MVQQVGTPIEVYSRPANRFVFEFIGLSSFLDVELSPDAMRVAGDTVALSAPPPPDLVAAGRAVLAARPDEIAFVDDGGIAGVVARKAYLGEVIDYRVMVGDAEVRVQTSRRAPGPSTGAACRLAFTQPRWYPTET